MDFTRLSESDDYRRQREELRVAELDLIDHAERVAALRRKLPTDTAVSISPLPDARSSIREPVPMWQMSATRSSFSSDSGFMIRCEDSDISWYRWTLTMMRTYRNEPQ